MPSTCAKFGIQFKNLDNQFVHFSQDQIENFNYVKFLIMLILGENLNSLKYYLPLSVKINIEIHFSGFINLFVFSERKTYKEVRVMVRQCLYSKQRWI